MTNNNILHNIITNCYKNSHLRKNDAEKMCKMREHIIENINTFCDYNKINHPDYTIQGSYTTHTILCLPKINDVDMDICVLFDDTLYTHYNKNINKLQKELHVYLQNKIDNDKKNNLKVNSHIGKCAIKINTTTTYNVHFDIVLYVKKKNMINLFYNNKWCVDSKPDFSEIRQIIANNKNIRKIIMFFKYIYKNLPDMYTKYCCNAKCNKNCNQCKKKNNKKCYINKNDKYNKCKKCHRIKQCKLPSIVIVSLICTQYNTHKQVFNKIDNVEKEFLYCIKLSIKSLTSHFNVTLGTENLLNNKNRTIDKENTLLLLKKIYTDFTNFYKTQKIVLNKKDNLVCQCFHNSNNKYIMLNNNDYYRYKLINNNIFNGSKISELQDHFDDTINKYITANTKNNLLIDPLDHLEL
jgi:hypothetical protein